MGVRINLDTEEEKELLLQLLEKKGYRWREGQKATGYYPGFPVPNCMVGIDDTGRLFCNARCDDGISFPDFLKNINCL